MPVTEEKPTYLQDYMMLYPTSYIYYLMSPYWSIKWEYTI